MKEGEGKKVWLFPDGELPVPSKNSELVAHEALMVLNTADSTANLNITIYFEKDDPVENIPLTVKSKRVKCIRLDDPDEIGGFKIPYNTQYALKVESDLKVVVTFGRLDTTSEKMAFYTSSWYWGFSTLAMIMASTRSLLLLGLGWISSESPRFLKQPLTAST